MGNSMLNLRCPNTRLKYDMELPILIGWNPNIHAALGGRGCRSSDFCEYSIVQQSNLNLEYQFETLHVTADYYAQYNYQIW